MITPSGHDVPHRVHLILIGVFGQVLHISKPSSIRSPMVSVVVPVEERGMGNGDRTRFGTFPGLCSAYGPEICPSVPLLC